MGKHHESSQYTCQFIERKKMTEKNWKERKNHEAMTLIPKDKRKKIRKGRTTRL